MSRGGLRRLGGLLGSAALVALGCGRLVVVSTGGETGSGSADDGGASSTSSSGTSGSSGTGSSGSSGSGSSSTSPTDTGGSGTGGSNTSATSTTTTAPACDPIQLAEVGLGIGGFVLDGETEDHHSAGTVSGAGDMNGDGLGDVVLGAWSAHPNGPNSGRSYVVFGKANADVVSLADVALGTGGFAMDGETAYSGFGRSVSGAGDVNGDGIVDVVVGSHNMYVPGSGSGVGRSYVVFGKANTALVELADVEAGTGGFAMDGHARYVNEPAPHSGWSVSGAGDVNGDGLADVVVGAPRAQPIPYQFSGRSHVVFGKADTSKVDLADVVEGSGGFAMVGEAGDGRSGWSVSGAGDINGDGLADVIVGAPRFGPISLEYGCAYVVFGKASTDLVSLADVAAGIGGFAMDGEEPGHRAGAAVSGAGDVNGDGMDDVIVGAPGRYSGENVPPHGRAYVVFGKADTAPVPLADVAEGIGGFVMEGEAENDQCGRSVSTAGDLNGDGLAEVLVGAPWADLNGLESYGRVYVVFGKAGTGRVSLANVAQGISGFAMDGEAEGDMAGESVSSTVDINGDGIPEIIVGAEGADPNGLEDAGRTYVVFGGDLSCDAG